MAQKVKGSNPFGHLFLIFRVRLTAGHVVLAHGIEVRILDPESEWDVVQWVERSAVN